MIPPPPIFSLLCVDLGHDTGQTDGQTDDWLHSLRWLCVICLSVRHSVCPVSKSTIDGPSKLKIGRKESRDTRDPWPNLEVERSKVKVFRPINAETENAPYLPHVRGQGKKVTSSITRQRTVAESTELAGRLYMPRLTFRTGSMVKESKVKLNVTRSLRVAVQVATCRGVGAFCGGRSTDRTACYRVWNPSQNLHAVEKKLSQQWQWQPKRGLVTCSTAAIAARQWETSSGNSIHVFLLSKTTDMQWFKYGRRMTARADVGGGCGNDKDDERW